MQQKPQQQQQGPVISSLHPWLQRQWDHAKNLHLGNIVVKPFSNMKVWWKCEECPGGHPHSWQATVNSRTTRTRRPSISGCPYCAGQAVCPHNSLAVNDFVVAAQWSPANSDKPEDYTVGSKANKVWRCDGCGKEWTASITNRTKATHPTGCPHCAKQRKKAKRQRRPPVIESQHAMNFWDWAANQEAGLDPHNLTNGSNKHAHWVCHACPKSQPHSWTATVSRVCGGNGCPCCQGRKACICNSLQSLRPDIAAEWDHDRNIGTPNDYSAHSNKSVWWQSKTRGRIEATIGGRTKYIKKRDR